MRNMYALNNIFLLSLFVTAAFSDIQENIREKGSVNKLAVSNSTVTSTLAVNNTKSILSTSVNSTHLPNNQLITEGGSVSSTAASHSGREHVLESPATKTTLGNATESSNLTLINPKVVIPVHDVHNESPIHDLEVVPHHDHEKSVPKKGVEFPDSHVPLNGPTNLDIIKKVSNITSANISSKNSSTNTTVIYKKPLVTESDSDSLNGANGKEDNSKESALTIDQIDPVLADKKSNRSDYIVPIVAVILSVPLVAILISMLYKRGTDWWQHRNYKRMDFLIEGMYHN